VAFLTKLSDRIKYPNKSRLLKTASKTLLAFSLVIISMLALSSILMTLAYAANSTSHQVKINVYDSTNLINVLETCETIKTGQTQNHTYTTGSYNAMVQECEQGQNTLSCLNNAIQSNADASECNNPDDETEDIEDAIRHFVPAGVDCATNPNAPGCGTYDPDPDPDPDDPIPGTPTPTGTSKPNPPRTGTFDLDVFGKTYTVSTVPFTLLTIATISTIAGICLLIKYKRTYRDDDNDTTRDHEENYGTGYNRGTFYQVASTASVMAVFAILVFTIAHIGAGQIVNMSDEPEPTNITPANVIINVDKKYETTNPIEKTAIVTTTVATTSETGYTLSAKLDTDQDTTDALAAGITAGLNTKELGAVAVEIYSSGDDTSPDTHNHDLAVTIPSNIANGAYILTITYEAEDGEEAEPEPSYLNQVVTNNNITTMQTLTSALCNSADYDHTNNGANANNTATLTDTRNSQQYMIRKLADGNCWMVTNLKLGSTSSTTPLTPANTNIASNWSLPIVGTATTYDFDTPRAYGPVPGSTNNIADSTFYGYLYNWCAATAGGTASGGSNTCTGEWTTPANATGDICPANWRLPSASSYEFSWLNAKMNNPSASSPYGYSADPTYYNNWQFTGPFRGVFSGYRDGSSWLVQGSYGYWWSSSRYYNDDPYFTSGSVLGSSSVNPDIDGNGRSHGFAVRCLLNN